MKLKKKNWEKNCEKIKIYHVVGMASYSLRVCILLMDCAMFALLPLLAVCLEIKGRLRKHEHRHWCMHNFVVAVPFLISQVTFSLQGLLFHLTRCSNNQLSSASQICMSFHCDLDHTFYSSLSMQIGVCKFDFS